MAIQTFQHLNEIESHCTNFSNNQSALIHELKPRMAVNNKMQLLTIIHHWTSIYRLKIPVCLFLTLNKSKRNLSGNFPELLWLNLWKFAQNDEQKN